MKKKICQHFIFFLFLQKLFALLLLITYYFVIQKRMSQVCARIYIYISLCPERFKCLSGVQLHNYVFIN